MIRSMTGYGRGEAQNELYRFKVELKAVNHRYNDIFVKMPRHISYLEESIKKIIKEKISRGKVDVYINLEYINESSIDVKVDIPLAKSYKIALEELVDGLALEDNIRLNNILGMPEVVSTERKELDEDLIWLCLSQALHIALDNILKMRELEGKELKSDILDKLHTLEEIADKVKERSPQVVLEYKDKLKERIRVLLEDNALLDEDRLSSEVAFFADRCSIDEEIVRLGSHIKQFRNILEESESIGRKLDFLTQELNREINTIGSKANDLEITSNVVNMKAEIEKIREQIQNIE